MFNKIILAVMVFSMIGCAGLKKRHTAGEETPELKAARAECQALMNKETASKDSIPIARKFRARSEFVACMDHKGYDRYGKKVR